MSNRLPGKVLNGVRMVAAGLALTLAAGASAQQPYPTKPIRWVVGFPAGGGTDVIARALAAAISPGLGQTVVVENRTGAAGSIAAEAVAKSPADGYTIFTGDNGILIYNPMVYRKVPYDPIRDFAPVSMIAHFPLVLAVNPASPIRTLKDYVDAATKEPGKLTYGSPGAGSPHHLAMELFRDMARIDIVHAPYRGGAPAMQDMLAGTLPSVLIDYVTAQGALRAGKVRPLAVSTAKRIAGLPDTPTFVEAGYPAFVASAFQGVVVPAATPREVIARLNRELVSALNSPEILKRLMEFGVEPASGTPEQFSEMIRSETTRWQGIVRSRNIQLDL